MGHRRATIIPSVLIVALLAGAAGATQISSDETWSGRFGPNSPVTPGVDPWPVNVFIIDGDDVYVGGQIESAGISTVAGVAKWYGGGFIPVGSELTGITGPEVWDMVMSDGLIYAGGEFTVDNGPESHIAVWDGSAWSAVGGGADDRVFSVAVAGGYLYIAGFFSNVGTGGGQIAARHVARWDGVSWSWPSAGLSVGNESDVFEIYTEGNDVYIGGEFPGKVKKLVGGAWQVVGSGFNSDFVVRRIIRYNGTLLAGGNLQSVGFRGEVYELNGSTWEYFGGDYTTEGPSVRDMAVFQGDLYATGVIQIMGGSDMHDIIRWDGSQWQPLGDGLDNWGHGLGAAADRLWIGGRFDNAGGAPAGRIALWDGTQFIDGIEADNGLDGSAYAMALSATGDIVVGGSFTDAGGSTHNRVATFDGSSWSPMGAGVDGTVRAVTRRGSDIIVGGEFSNAGGAPANRIALWDGTSWSDMGDADGTVYALHSSATTTYAGGAFTTIGGQAANRVAAWDGLAWSPMGNGLIGTVRAITTQGDEVVAGGIFINAGGSVPVNRIARWDGATWNNMAGGADSPVYALAVWQGEVYAGGQFITIGGVTANGLARWDGESWHAADGGINPGINNGVFALRPAASELIVGGEFQTIGGQSFANMARWDGQAYESFGTGTDERVQAIALTPDGVYAGGDFTRTGHSIANHIGRWNEQLATGIDPDTPVLSPLRLEQNSPNPFNPTTTIRFSLQRGAHVRLVVYDVTGLRVRTLLDEPMAASAHDVTWDGRDDRGRPVASGIYFYKLTAAGRSQVRKMTLVK